MSFEIHKNLDPVVVSKGELSKRWPRALTEREKSELGVGEKKIQKQKETAGGSFAAMWKNPETGKEQSIEINLEEKLSEFKAFFKDKFNLEINETEVKKIWNKNYTEIKSEVEKYGYDSVLIIPDNLPSESDINQKAVETMDEGAGKGKVVATKYWAEQSSIAFVGENKYKIILVHSDQNIYDNPDANPYLKTTLNKNIMALTGLAPKEIEKKINSGQELPANFEAEINGKKMQIQASGLSLEEYEIFQRMYFEKNRKHLDESGWIWLMKSRSGSRVVISSWDPDDRRLSVNALVPGYARAILGLRLSRSFSN